ncbi:hypothetical protein HDU87_000996 [Geranomyces variabilis]|uniref:Protein kinase domain-containing protein n=1 Tax=Geranomyces variabilis TaxID=109894 RepID=A0AAD5XNJ8_9FUNG|nr:hypothetical protein HDU87_000996 [Geranomyces variabilis]
MSTQSPDTSALRITTEMSQRPTTPKRLTQLIPQLRSASRGSASSGGSSSSQQILSDVLEQLSPVCATPVSARLRGGSDEWEGVLEEYTIVKTIGEGSFGKVKLAVHLATGEQVAIKVMPKPAATTPDPRSKDAAGAADDDDENNPTANAPTSTDRILREILVLSHLSHPNISRLLQVVSTPENIFLVLEYESGGELFDHIATHPSGRVPEPQARKMFRELCSAVQYCHASGVVHRDLKPENLLLDADGAIKIIDYGFTNLVKHDGKMLETFCGSAAYAAPEMIAGKKYTGPEADVWSMGVILYVIVAGVMPFDDRHMARMFAAIMGGKYKIPENVSAECADLIKQILKTNPHTRATLQDIAKHPWTTDNGALSPLRLYQQPSGVDDILPFDPAEHQVDQAVVNELIALRYDAHEVVDAVQSGEPGPLTAAYWLVRKRRARDAAKGGAPATHTLDAAVQQQQQQQQQQARPALRVNISGTEFPVDAIKSPTSRVAKSAAAPADSAIEMYTPRSAQAVEIVLPPPPAAAAAQQSKDPLQPSAAEYTYATHAPTNTLLDRLRRPSANTAPPQHVPVPNPAAISTKPAFLMPPSTLPLLARHPHVTLAQTSPTQYTCTVTLPPRHLSPLDAQTPELAMEMILGDFLAGWSFRLEQGAGSVGVWSEEEEKGPGDFEQNVRALVAEVESGRV